jgi:hypothetical protein
MAQFTRKSAPVEAITFDELAEHAAQNGGHVTRGITNGLPWAFHYKGCPVTYEGDDCYLIHSGNDLVRMTRDHMLVAESGGDVSVCRRDEFDATHDPHRP